MFDHYKHKNPIMKKGRSLQDGTFNQIRPRFDHTVWQWWNDYIIIIIIKKGFQCHPLASSSKTQGLAYHKYHRD